MYISMFGHIPKIPEHNNYAQGNKKEFSDLKNMNFVNSTKKKEEERKKKVGYKVASNERRLKISKDQLYLEKF